MEITTLSQVTGNFLACLGWDLNPGSGEIQRAVSGSASERSAIIKVLVLVIS